MSKIERYAGNLRAFGSNAQGLERTLFGEETQGDDLTSQVTNSFLRGWGIVGPSENPSMEDFNAAMYTMSQFIAYQHQVGVPEWHESQEYYTGSVCTHGGVSYQSLDDENIGNEPPSAKWTPVLTAKNGGDYFQPKNGNLTALSGLTGSAGRIPYFTSAGAMSLLAGFGANATTTTVTSPGGGFALGVRSDGAWSVVNNTTGDRSALSVSAGGTGSTTPAGARTNLELGSAATASVGTGANQIPSMASFGSGDNWCILPNGKIMQWGSYTGSSSSGTISFPVPFIVNPVTVVIGLRGTATDSSAAYVIQDDNALSKTSFAFRRVGSQFRFNWFCIEA